MTKYITALILILTMNQTQAAPLTIGWSLATEREDGMPLDISEIKGTNLYFKIAGFIGGPWLLPAETTSLFFNTTESEFCFRRTTLLKDGLESEPTEWFCMSNTPEVPQ